MTDQDSLQEDTTKPKKAKGRPKNINYLPWKEAREFVRSEMLPSKGKFDEWYKKNQPKVIPPYPYRTYTAEGEWAGWNDFLGTNNSFGAGKGGTIWRPIDEAVKWSHALGLKTYNQWLEHCRENEIPADIPKRPDMTYDKWRSWSHWLGNSPESVVEVAREAQKTQVYYLIHEIGVPENVITYGVEAGGVAAMKDRYKRGGIHIVKLFWFDPEKAPLIKQIVESLSSSYVGSNNQRITSNVYAIIEYLQYHLDTIR